MLIRLLRRASWPARATSADPTLRVASWVAYVLDDVGVDPILGLVLPGVGDFVASAAGLSLVVIAWRRRLSLVVVARMLLNLALDAGVGAIPLLGDAFDWYFRANTRNLRLLEQHQSKRGATLTDWLVLLAAGVVFCAAMILPLLLLAWLCQAYILPSVKGLWLQGVASKPLSALKNS